MCQSTANIFISSNLKFNSMPALVLMCIRKMCYIARKHGRVFRMTLHNEGVRRMETCQRARQVEYASPGVVLCHSEPMPNAFLFLAATKQLYKWYFPSVRQSVRLSVTPFWLCSHHRIIMKFSGVITNDQRKVHAKGQGQRSKVKVTEVTTQLNRFRTVTPVWIHIWWWNDAYSLMLLRRGAVLFFKVIRQISRSHGSKNRRIWPRLGVSGL